VSMADVGRLALITVTPTLLGAAVLYAPRICAAIARLLPARREDHAAPLGPPIERIAADLRRLLRLHDELSRSAQLATRAHRLWSVEAAITVRAQEAARALDLAHESPPETRQLPRTELAALLRAIADAGLVLPTSVGHFTRNGRL
jgi:hypothetical protein